MVADMAAYLDELSPKRPQLQIQDEDEEELGDPDEAKLVPAVDNQKIIDEAIQRGFTAFTYADKYALIGKDEED